MATEADIRNRIETLENRQYIISSVVPPEETGEQEPIVYSDYSVWFKTEVS